MRIRAWLFACGAVGVCWLAGAQARAQSPPQGGGPFSGRLVNALSGEPIPGANVVIEELKRETTSGQDGSFTFDNVPPGNYHLAVHAQLLSRERRRLHQVIAETYERLHREQPDRHLADLAYHYYAAG